MKKKFRYVVLTALLLSTTVINNVPINKVYLALTYAIAESDKGQANENINEITLGLGVIGAVSSANMGWAVSVCFTTGPAGWLAGLGVAA